MELHYLTHKDLGYLQFPFCIKIYNVLFLVLFFVQELNQDDYERQIEFSKILSNCVLENRIIAYNIYLHLQYLLLPGNKIIDPIFINENLTE